MKKPLIALATTVALVGPAVADDRSQGLETLRWRMDPHNLLNAHPSEVLATLKVMSGKSRAVVLAAMAVHNQRCQRDAVRGEFIGGMIFETYSDRSELFDKKVTEFEAMPAADFCPAMTDALASTSLTVRWDCPPPAYWGQWISCYSN